MPPETCAGVIGPVTVTMNGGSVFCTRKGIPARPKRQDPCMPSNVRWKGNARPALPGRTRSVKVGRNAPVAVSRCSNGSWRRPGRHVAGRAAGLGAGERGRPAFLERVAAQHADLHAAPVGQVEERLVGIAREREVPGRAGLLTGIGHRGDSTAIRLARPADPPRPRRGGPPLASLQRPAFPETPSSLSTRHRG
jgi:hypothetical protein